MNEEENIKANYDIIKEMSEADAGRYKSLQRIW